MTNPPEPMPMLKRPEVMPRHNSPDSAYAILRHFHDHIYHGAAWDDRIEDVAQAADYHVQLRPSMNIFTVRDACLRIANDQGSTDDVQILAKYTKSIFPG